MLTHTNTNAVRSAATHDVQHTHQFHSETSGPWLSEPTDGMPHQPIIDPAGAIAPGPAWAEGSIR